MRKSKAVETSPPSHEMLNELIARKAYELFEQRGGNHGYDFDDWLTAERFIREEASAAGSSAKIKGKVVSMRRKKTDG